MVKDRIMFKHLILQHNLPMMMNIQSALDFLQEEIFKTSNTSYVADKY